MTAVEFRIKAFLTHLFVSVLIAAISLIIVFMVWHPAPLATAVGVTHIFIMMLAIDAVLGPLLTLIVAQQGKKSLKFDLSVIVILQLSAFIYGIYNIAISRPVYIVFDSIRFEVVQANNIPKSSLEAAISPYNTLGWGSPKFVAVKPAESVEQKNNRTFVELETGIAPSMQPDLYTSLESQWDRINQSAKSLKTLYSSNSKVEVDKTLSQYPVATTWLPLKAYEQDMVVLMDSDNHIVNIVDLRPY